MLSSRWGDRYRCNGDGRCSIVKRSGTPLRRSVDPCRHFSSPRFFSWKPSFPLPRVVCTIAVPTRSYTSRKDGLPSATVTIIQIRFDARVQVFDERDVRTAITVHRHELKRYRIALVARIVSKRLPRNRCATFETTFRRCGEKTKIPKTARTCTQSRSKQNTRVSCKYQRPAGCTATRNDQRSVHRTKRAI
jgi:hypothetical protein